MVAVTRTPRGEWIEQGLKALASGGPDAVRIEALAQSLGVSKGGFYGFFADRTALLDALLDTWESEAINEVLAHAAAEGGDARTKLQRAGQLTFASDRLLPIDLAIRDWARRDRVVAQRLRRVDNQRMEYMRELLATFCSDPVEIEARAFLAFSLVLGNHLLAAQHGTHTRNEVLARAAKLLLDDPSQQTRP
ncbi:TetR/AcrR family transcriptional regulator [Mycolicibacterium fluoranthenivorans]|uniref:TetR/AcrR family transcriptional regulator n=1 Tax=Mycolicibacterium fluoranthenivorans TaxID=258505 RepID=A0A7G8PDU7_9MYCO|nr:TetR/AcrR family transcriptional regulator [Mycolicibacterium fluoranthenivorans]QNJ91211.1 TetR/AcrR family transcriptional regulator [Mycolicibacterium fluoranthenivorans]QNJ92513.1 TetR/AcrR family transcriptional regulator [Mycolicibacterium fluoranthenivorans]